MTDLRVLEIDYTIPPVSGDVPVFNGTDWAPSPTTSILGGTITRVSNLISSVLLSSGRNIVISRSGNYISSITDGVRTWTFTRNGSNQITSWTVT